MVFIVLAFFITGVVLLVRGSKWFVVAAELLGKRVGLSPFVTGVVIVGFATPLPELTSSLMAQLQGAESLVAGNAIGSNVTNVLLILSLGALLASGVRLAHSVFEFDKAWLILSTGVFVWVAHDGAIHVGESLVLLLLFLVYALSLYTTVQEARLSHSSRSLNHRASTGWISLQLLLGIGILTLGAYLTIASAIALANMLSIGVEIVGLLAVAIGTSLPELSVAIQSVRRSPDLAIGNIFGSNIFNMLVVVGLPGLFGTLSLQPATFAVGIPFLLISTAVLLYVGFSKQLNRNEGTVGIALFVCFILLVSMFA